MWLLGAFEISFITALFGILISQKALNFRTAATFRKNNKIRKCYVFIEAVLKQRNKCPKNTKLKIKRI
jgi:hypothetical protein